MIAGKPVISSLYSTLVYLYLPRYLPAAEIWFTTRLYPMLVFSHDPDRPTIDIHHHPIRFPHPPSLRRRIKVKPIGSGLPKERKTKGGKISWTFLSDFLLPASDALQLLLHILIENTTK